MFLIQSSPFSVAFRSSLSLFFLRLISVDRSVEGDFGSFHDRLGECGVGMDGESHVFRHCAHLNGKDSSSNQFPRVVSDDADAKDFLSLRLQDEFRQSVGRALRNRAPRSRPREGDDPDLAPCILGCCFR